MKFRRNAGRPVGRQKLRADDLTPAPQAFSYRARRSEEVRSVERQAHQRDIPVPGQMARFWLQRFGLMILLVAAVASLTNVLALSSDAKVVPLTNGVNRSLLRSLTVYQQAADQKLADSLWNRNKVTIDTGGLSRQLLSQFPELNSVSITVPLLAHRPLIYVEPAQPALLLVAGNGSFVIDTRGKALLTAASMAASGRQSNLPVVDDQTGLTVQLNHQALSVENVSFIQTVAGQLTAKHFTISTMTLPTSTSELDVHLNGQPYFIKFNLKSSNPRGEAGTFLATIAQLHRQNVTPAQYVDVRVDGRAYYK
jgi:hypothetical protein